MKRLELKRIKRWPTLKRHLSNQHVRIFSREHGCYWREGYSGYTYHLEAAGVYKFEDALDHTFHCGPEKGIEFEAAEPEYSI